MAARRRTARKPRSRAPDRHPRSLARARRGGGGGSDRAPRSRPGGSRGGRRAAPQGGEVARVRHRGRGERDSVAVRESVVGRRHQGGDRPLTTKQSMSSDETTDTLLYLSNRRNYVRLL